LTACASLTQLNTRLRPDMALAAAWGRARFADPSTITRVLDALTPPAVAQLRTAVEQLYRREGLALHHVPAKPRQHVVIRPRRGSILRGAARQRAPADGEAWGAQAPRLAKADLLLTLLAGPCYLQRIKLQTTAPACRSWTRMPERCLVMAVRIRALLFT